MDQVEIDEAGLLLRPWLPADADAVHRACQDPDIQRWTTLPSPYLPEHAAGFVTEVSRRAWRDATGAPFAVCDAGSGELLGSCGLVSIDHVQRSAEIGYWTAPWARGRGVAVRASLAVSRWAFDALGLRRIIWQATLGNHASRLVALRAGFRVEGRLRLAQPHPSGTVEGWVGSLLPDDLTDQTAPDERSDQTAPSGPGGAMTGGRGRLAGPGSVDARHAAIFGRPQPVLFANTPATRHLAGEEIRLRQPEWRDIPAIVTACQDPATTRWTSVPVPYLPRHAEQFVMSHAPTRWAGADGAVFTVADADDGYLGTVELRLTAGDPNVGDVGFLIAPSARGRGYGTAALAAVSAWGCTNLGLARIEWRAQVGNFASRRTAERAGFVVEGTARNGLGHRGSRVDAWFGAFTVGGEKLGTDGGFAG